MKRKQVILLASAVLLGLLPRAGEASSLEDYPLGYLNIEEGPDGAVAITARCVPAADLISKLAVTAGKTVEFAKPYQTYISIWRPGQYRDPLGWIEYISIQSFLAVTKTTGSNILIYQIASGDKYAPELSEAGIIARYRTSSPPSPASIDEGMLLIEGQLVQGPFTASVQDSSDGGLQVLVNNHPVSEFAPHPLSFQYKAEDYVLPPSGQFESHDELRDYVMWNLYPAALRKGGKTLAWSETLGFLRSQKIAEEVFEAHGNIECIFSDSTFRVESPIFHENYDQDTGALMENAVEVDNPADRAAAYAESLQDQLRQDHVLIVNGRGMIVFDDPSNVEVFLQKIKLARQVDLLKAECVLNEFLTDPVASRTLAANLAVWGEQLTAHLNAIQQRAMAVSQDPGGSPVDATVLDALTEEVLTK